MMIFGWRFYAVFLPALALQAQSDPPCTLRTALGDPQVFSGDGGPATEARLLAPSSVALDGGALYVADRWNHRIRRVAGGTIETVAGTGEPSAAVPQDGSASEAALHEPANLAVAPGGDVYFVDGPSRRFLRRLHGGEVETLATAGGAFVDLALNSAGEAVVAESLDGGARLRRWTAAGALESVPGGDSLPDLRAIASGSDGLYFAERGAERIQRLGPDGALEFIAGAGGGGSAGDGGPAADASFAEVRDIAFAPNGDLLVQDRATIRFVRAGVIETFAPFLDLQRIFPAADGVYAALGNQVVRVQEGGAFDVVAGRDPLPTITAGAPADRVALAVRGVAAGQGEAFAVVGSFLYRFRDGRVDRIAGGGGDPAQDGGLPLETRFSGSRTCWRPPANCSCWRTLASGGRPPGGALELVAGGGSTNPETAAETPALEAQFRLPEALAQDAAGDLYLLSESLSIDGSQVVLRISPGGAVTVVSVGVALDPADNYVDLESGPDGLYVASSQGVFRRSERLRRVGPQELRLVTGLAAGPDGTLFTASAELGRIWRIASDGAATMLSGGGPGFSFSEGQPAGARNFLWPETLSLSPEGDLLVGDPVLARVRSIAQAAACQPGDGPALSENSTVNAASFLLPNTLAPGEIVSTFGQNIGPDELVLGEFVDGALATEAGGVRVLVNGEPAPVLLASRGQINWIVPFAAAGGEFAIEREGVQIGTNAMTVVPSAPGIFMLPSPAGQAAALNEDGSVNGPDNPAAPGSIVVLFATGAGLTDPPGEDGRITPPSEPLPRAVQSVEIGIGGEPAQVLYAGAAPQLVAGVLQINAAIPTTVSAGDAVAVRLSIGDGENAGQDVTVAVR